MWARYASSRGQSPYIPDVTPGGGGREIDEPQQNTDSKDHVTDCGYFADAVATYAAHEWFDTDVVQKMSQRFRVPEARGDHDQARMKRYSEFTSTGFKRDFREPPALCVEGDNYGGVK
jgi:hypothetical protein